MGNERGFGIRSTTIKLEQTPLIDEKPLAIPIDLDLL